MANIIPLKDNTGAQFYPQTHEKAVIDNNGVTLSSKLAGALSNEYVAVDSLPTASASTMGKKYVVPISGSTQKEVWVTSQSGSSYTWVSLGTQDIDMSGYVTEEELNQLDQAAVKLVYNTIDLSSLPEYNFSIKSDGTYGTGSSYKHTRVAVEGGACGISITANSNSPARIAFLASNAAPVAGGTIPVVQGTSVIEIPSGQSALYKIPAGAVSVAIYKGQENAFTPSSVLLGSFVLDTLASTSTKNALSAKQGNVLRGIATLNYRQPELQSAGLRGARINSSLRWNNTARYRHIIVAVQPYETITVKANGDYPATIGFLYEAGTPINDTDAPIVPGTALTEIPVGTSATLSVPAGTAYMYINSGDVQNGNSYARIYLPSAMEAYGTIVGPDNRSKANAAAIENLSILKPNVQTQFVGKGTTQVGTPNIYNFAPGQSYRCVILNPNVALEDTSGENYRFQLRAYDKNGETVETIIRFDTATSLPDYVDFIVPTGTDYIRVLGRCVTDAVFPVIFFPITSSPYTGGILDLNPGAEFIPKFLSAKKRYYTSTDANRPNPLVVLHLSDIHGNWDNVARFLEFAVEYSDYVDELVNTGDTVLGLYTDGIAGYAALPGVSDIINVIGNHDTREGNDWQAHIGLDAYNLLIAPHVSSWGVTQPADAATEGYCYFYKDYAEKNIRMVFVDVMSYDATEDTWLASVLASAKEAGYHVVIFVHFAGARSTSEEEEAVFSKVACNYTSLYPLGSSSVGLTGYNSDAYKMNDTVADFMEAGGKFIGFVQGHYHTDFVAKVAKYPGQLIYSIGATKAGEMRDFNHIVGTRDQDEFQIVAIDTVNTIVKLYKVGANYDRYGRSKGSVCVDYSTGDVLGEGF